MSAPSPVAPVNADDFNLVVSSLRGENGSDQERIAKTVFAALALMLRKNKDYGSAVWEPSVFCPELNSGQTIRVRMSDKVRRIQQLLKNADDPAVLTESLEDTIADLGNYCYLLLARPH